MAFYILQLLYFANMKLLLLFQPPPLSLFFFFHSKPSSKVRFQFRVGRQLNELFNMTARLIARRFYGAESFFPYSFHFDFIYRRKSLEVKIFFHSVEMLSFTLWNLMAKRCVKYLSGRLFSCWIRQVLRFGLRPTWVSIIVNGTWLPHVGPSGLAFLDLSFSHVA